MDTLTLSVEIPEDRRLVIDLPADMPPGAAELTIRSHATEISPLNEAREIARAKLLAGTALNISHHAPDDAVALSDEELEQHGQLAPGARSSEEIVNEERGDY